jgi:hypothetical protein
MVSFKVGIAKSLSTSSKYHWRVVVLPFHNSVSSHCGDVVVKTYFETDNAKRGAKNCPTSRCYTVGQASTKSRISVCYICGNSTQHVTKPNATPTIGGVTTTCSILDHGGSSGFIQAPCCETFLVFQIPSKCGCAPISPPPSASKVTARLLPSPVPTVRPTAKPSL